jgi:hypothetical protein
VWPTSSNAQLLLLETLWLSVVRDRTSTRPRVIPFDEDAALHCRIYIHDLAVRLGVPVKVDPDGLSFADNGSAALMQTASLGTLPGQ